jgi:hypothetical protein
MIFGKNISLSFSGFDEYLFGGNAQYFVKLNDFDEYLGN